MPLHSAVLVTLSIGLTLAAAGWSRADKKPVVENAENAKATANAALRDAAKKAYENAFRLYEAGVQTDIEVLYRWSKC